MNNAENEKYIKNIYSYLLERDLDEQGKNYYINSNKSYIEIFNEVLNSKEYEDIFFNKKNFSNIVDSQIMVFSGNEINKHYSDVEEIVYKKNYFIENNEYKKTPLEMFNNVDDDINISYKINSSGHRSEEFTHVHDGAHILFAGCSFTFGEGLPYKNNWSGKLYNQILKNIKISGYYNLSYLGGGIDIIVNNIYKYINNYGVPDYLFVLFPEIKRKYKYENGIFYSDIPLENNKYKNYNNLKNAVYQNFVLIKNLEIFLNNTRCNFLWTTWDSNDVEIFNKMLFTNFIYATEHDIINSATNYEESTSKYFYRSRDGWHPGLVYSDGLSNIFMEKIYEKNIL